jgi:hypothetical protein
MKKLLFTLVASAFAIANAYAQDSFATFAALEHNGNITTFTGGKALQEAVAAADNGDVITLSAGAFYLSDYLYPKKSITLRGAGIDVKSGKNLTYVGGHTVLFDSNTSMASFVFEGIDFDCGISTSGNGPEHASGSITINKCLVNHLQTYAKNVVITNSKIYEMWVREDASAKCHNSVIYISGYSTNRNYNTTYTNCVVIHGHYGTYERCICAWMGDSNHQLADAFTLCPAKDCIYILDKSDIPVSAINVDITYVVNWSDVFDFEEFDASPDFMRQQTFTPKQSGYYTYSPLLDLPTIKDLTVDKESTADGKLSIDVEIAD